MSEEAIRKLDRALELLETIAKTSHQGFSVYPNEHDKSLMNVRNAKRILEEKPQLNNNQQTVLEYLKSNVEQENSSIMCSVFHLGDLWKSRKFNIEEDVKVDNAYCELNSTQQAEVLQVFAEWGLRSWKNDPKDTSRL